MLSIAELKAAGYAKKRDRWMFDGFLPRLYDSRIAPTQLYADYFKTYVERDVRNLTNLRNLRNETGTVPIRLVPGPVRIVPVRWFTNPRMSNLQILGPVVYYFSKAGVVHA